MKEKKVKRPNRFAFCLVTFILIVVIAINGIIWGIAKPYLGIVSQFLGGEPSSAQIDEAKSNAAKVTERIEDEGIVMLMNNGTLPLTSNAKVNVFGRGSISTTFGGSGSGAGDSSKAVSLYQGLENAGLQTNQDLKDFTSQNTTQLKQGSLLGNDFSLNEITYTDEMMKNAQSFSNTAIVVYSRCGGEGEDCPMDMSKYGGDKDHHYLEFSPQELELLQNCRKNFKRVIVLLNSPNTMELGELKTVGVDAALWVGTPGSTGCNSIGRVISGAVNPSGRTTDTFAYSVESNPTYYNFGNYEYTNLEQDNNAVFAGTSEVAAGKAPHHYVEYKEGIYVGYRYYETAAADGFINYDETVQFPFGYGLSYTTFDEKIADIKDDGDQITVTVNVTNTGKVAGKDVVELYYSAPYTKGGIEKASCVLGGFAKTKDIEPGKGETVTITLKHEDMASYDYKDIKAKGGAYVLEAGEYKINIQSDSHTVKDSRSINVASDVIYNDEGTGKRSSDNIAATNQFDDVSFGDGLTYLSRADWQGTFPTLAPKQKAASDAQVEAVKTGTEFKTSGEKADVKTKNNGLKLKDFKDVDYDDPKWDDLLDQISIDEMKMLVGNGGWSTQAVKSVDKPFMVEVDGPGGLNNILANQMKGIHGNQYACQCVVGQTWSEDVAHEMGLSYNAEARAFGVSGIYGPAMDIHRSPFSGRNFEYYSEDGLLSGKMAANVVKGLQSDGVFCYSKHFALNDQETNRTNVMTWANEQAMREIYFKGFETCVKEGGTLGIMSAYNRLGTTPCAESYPLLTTVLRNEWGFRGAVITDCVLGAYTEDVNKALLAGNDLQLSFLAQAGLVQVGISDETSTSADGVKALRQATKNILYMDAHSGAMDYANYGMPWVEIVILVVDAINLALFFCYYFFRHKKMKRWKASQQA